MAIIKYIVRDIHTGKESNKFTYFHPAWVLAGKMDDRYGEITTELIREVNGKRSTIPRPAH